jgi:hypothetical protein
MGLFLHQANEGNKEFCDGLLGGGGTEFSTHLRNPDLSARIISGKIFQNVFSSSFPSFAFV